MNHLFALALFITFLGCSAFQKHAPKTGKRLYSYADISGKYKLSREVKKLDLKLVARNQLLLTTGGNNKVVEKSILVSQLGTVGDGKQRLLAIRPLASDFSVWLEGKRYSSHLKLLPEKKSMLVTLRSPEAKWQGSSLVPVPKGRIFCFFGQIPECLFHSGYLDTAREEKGATLDFLIVWESYPFVQEQLNGVGKNLFAPASLKFDGELKGRFRYIIETEGQVLLYQFSRSNDLEKISWIAQGITIVPPGEEESSLEN